VIGLVIAGDVCMSVLSAGASREDVVFTVPGLSTVVLQRTKSVYLHLNIGGVAREERTRTLVRGEVRHAREVGEQE
jgi:hypothetical protein